MSTIPIDGQVRPQRAAWSDLSHRVRSLRPASGALLAILALAAALRFAWLDALGYANHYYTAAVAAMLQSPRNFFFVAAEPGGSVSIDKPPVGLWIEALSALVFGVNGFAVVLPQILAGILSVALLYHLVRRSFGEVAGLLAALALAITPVFVATNRNNTMDSVLILILLVAAWAFIRATETGRLRYLLAGALLVGVGFNVKMLEAYLPLPAFFALYFLGAAKPLGRKIANLALAGVVIVVVSLSWALVVDLTPVAERPYVGSSGDNSVLNLAIGYNGTQRLLGMWPGGRGGAPAGSPRDSHVDGPRARDGGQPFVGDGARQPGAAGATVAPGLPPPGANGGSQPMDGRGAGGGPGGFAGTGQAGPLRLFTVPLSKEASWLLPFGIFGGLLLAARSRPRWPLAREHQALVIWGGWLLTCGAFFSVAGFFHEYYLSMMAPPLAALFGIGVALAWSLRARSRLVATTLLVGAAGATLALQRATAVAFIPDAWWLPLALGLAVLGGAIALGAALRDRRRIAAAGFGVVVAALLVTPGVWSGLTALNPEGNQSLPAAYGGERGGMPGSGPARGLSVDQSLIDYLQPRTAGMTWMMAVPSSMQGADYVLATGRGVMYLGGFMGQDEVVTAESLARLVAAGELRFIYWSQGGGRGGPGGGGLAGQQSVSDWVTQTCVAVPGYEAATSNFGTPDGINPNGAGAGGSLRVSLYDCAAR